MCDDQKHDEATSHSLRQQTSGVRAEAIQWMQEDICDVCDACLHEVADICPENLVPARSYSREHHGPFSRSPADGDRTFVHHRTLDSLTSSIHGGCHFCIDLWNKTCKGEQGCVRYQVKVIADFEQDIVAIKRLLKSSSSCTARIAQDVRIDNIVSSWTIPPEENEIRIDSPWLYSMGKKIDVAGRHHNYYSSISVCLAPSIQTSGLRIEEATSSDGLTTGSGPSMKALLRWLHDCQSHHANCAPKKTWYPTRLVQLGANRAFRVIETSGSKRLLEPYCTLSYCWGDLSDRLLLTRESEQRLKAGVSLDELPKVLQDAAQVCAALGVRYLWVDSLCIKQDNDLDDWKRESQLMHKVYSNGYLNISATASSSPDQGLFWQRRLHAQITLRHETSLFQPGLHYHVYETSALTLARRELEETPLQRRAWALQERLLAPRNAHFGPNEIFWECNSTISCESYARIYEDCIPVCWCWSGTDANHGCFAACRQGILPRLRASHNDKDDATKRRLRIDWIDIQERYSGKDISYNKDRPVAIAGIAAIFETLLDDRFLFGLWAGDFRRALMWLSLGLVRHEVRLETVPSWSWLSSSFATYHDRQEHTPRVLLFSVVESEAELRALANCTLPPHVHLKGKMGIASIHRPREHDPIDRAKVLIEGREVCFDLDRPIEGRGTTSSFLERCQCYYMFAQESHYKNDDVYVDFFLFECTSLVSEKGGAVFRRLALSCEAVSGSHTVREETFQVPEGAGNIPSDSYDPDTEEHVICVA